MADTLQNGRFVLLNPLGQGAQGRTFDAVDKREGCAVAVKRFDVRTARTWKDAELAEREARVLQSLSNDRLPKYIDHFEEEGALYLVMQKIEGESLASLRKRGVRATEEDVMQLLRDASEVLDYLHQRSPPIVHRDLKPGNVLRRPDGSFAFVDFGAVRDKLRPEGGSTVIGTFGYMGPEQFQGRALPASDVYAIGATALAFILGEEPENLPHRGLAIDVRTALEGRASRPLVHVLERMLDPDPDKRAARIAPLLAELRSGRGRNPRSEGDGGKESHEPWESLWEKIPAGLERQAREFERRAEELEELASRGVAGSEGWRRGAEGWRKGAEKWRQAARKIARRHARRAERRAEREVRRATQREARNEGTGHARDAARAEGNVWPATRREAWRAHRERSVPWPIRLVLSLAFAVAIIAVSVVMQLIVPLVLILLSWFFGHRALAAAQLHVRAAGKSAVRAIAQTRRSFRPTRIHGADEHDGAGDLHDQRSRVEVRASAKVRVGEDASEQSTDTAATTEAAETESEPPETRTKRGPL